MYRVLLLILALTFVPSVVAAQQPCTTDARHVVNELYRHMLERAPDAGSAHWVQQLEGGQMTVRDVVRAIAMSPEYEQRFIRTEAGEGTPYERSVGRLYRHLLGRQPDTEGQRAFAQLAARSGSDAVVDQIVSSREYNQRFGDWGAPGSGGVTYCAPSGAVSRSQTVQPRSQAGGRFRNMDRNNDGRITQSEWRGSPRSFEVHDWNNDGVLSGSELDPGSARQGRTLQDEEFDRQEQFEFLDVNNNGRIEEREWHGSVAAFNRLDTNNDNRLTRAEFSGDTFAVRGTSGQSLTVDPRQRWTDTGLDVDRGEVMLFDVSGTIRMSDDPNDTASAGGAYSGRRARQAPLSAQSAGALIGRIDEGAPFYIGNRSSVRAPATGRLYFGVNDDHLADNEGSYQVMVTVE